MADRPFASLPGFQSLAQRTLGADGVVFERSCCPTMDLAAIVASNGKSVSLWRMTGHASASAPVWTLDGFSRVTSLAWSPDGLVLAIADEARIILQSVHPPSSVSHQIYPTINVQGKVEQIWWHALQLPALEPSPKMSFVLSLFPLKDASQPLRDTTLLSPASDKIEVDKRAPTSLDKFAPGFPRLIQGDATTSSVLVAITEAFGRRFLQLFLAGGISFGQPVELERISEIHGIHVRPAFQGEVFELLVYASTSSLDAVRLSSFTLRVDQSTRYLAQSTNHAYSMLQASINLLEEARKARAGAHQTLRAWLAKMERPSPEDTLMQILMTGRTPHDTTRDYLASKAAERAFRKWELHDSAAQTRAFIAAHQFAAPTCERILMLFPEPEFAVIHQQAEVALRKALALEEATMTQKRIFAEACKFLAYELDCFNRADHEPLPGGNAAHQANHNQPPPVQALYNPQLVAKWLAAQRSTTDEEEEDHLVPWIDQVIESLGRLAKIVRDASVSLKTAPHLQPGSSRVVYEGICDDVRSKTFLTEGGETRMAMALQNKVVIIRSDSSTNDDEPSQTEINLRLPGLSFDLCDLGFFDEQELVLLLLDAQSRAMLTTVPLNDLVPGHTDLSEAKRCQPLEQSALPLSLALNGRIGRRTGCILSATSLEVYDMDLDEADDDEAIAIDED